MKLRAKVVLLLAMCSAWPSAGSAAPTPEAEALARLEQAYAEFKTHTEQELARMAAEIERLRGNARTAPSGLTVSAGLRLRSEHNTGGDMPDRDRGALRARLQADYRINPALRIGARLTTGDPDDPNSSDVTLGDYGDDLTVSLDRAFVQYTARHTELTAGRFAHPFAATDLVWDGDVNPAGLALRWRLARGDTWSAHAAGLYAVIDEQVTGADSGLAGAQLALDWQPANHWQAGFDLAYYHYDLGSLTHADGGDLRDNRLTPDGQAYLSDFHLLDLAAEITWSVSTRWPVTVHGNVVRNLGAVDGEETGFEAGFSTGRLSQPGDVRIGYTYAVADADAVFAAFAQDNIPYGSNYRQHGLSVDYRITEGVEVNLTGYAYRRRDVLTPADDDTRTRWRLNWLVRF